MGPGCHIRSIEQLSPRVWIKTFDRPWTCSVKRFPSEPSPARRSHRWPVPKTCLRALCGSSSAVVAFVFALVSCLLEMKLFFLFLSFSIPPSPPVQQTGFQRVDSWALGSGYCCSGRQSQSRLRPFHHGMAHLSNSVGIHPSVSLLPDQHPTCRRCPVWPILHHSARRHGLC